MDKLTKILGGFILAGIIFLCGCSSYKPYEYESDREVKPGPGLFSGEDGAFTVYRKEAEKQETEQKTASEKSAREQ